MNMKVKINNIVGNKYNPRVIKDDKFNKLKKSISEFPEMLEKRAIVCTTRDDGKYEVIGGNMRFRVCQDLGYKEVPIILADDWSDKQVKQFIIKDNVSAGEWDWDALANNWDESELDDWGLNLSFNTEIEIDENEDVNQNPKKIKSPHYEVKGEKPNIVELFNSEKYKKLIENIEKTDISNDVKDFLKIAASRHIVFNYSNIAEYYAHADKETQSLMEESALVVIDFNDAIKNGFVLLTENIKELYNEDYE